MQFGPRDPTPGRSFRITPSRKTPSRRGKLVLENGASRRKTDSWHPSIAEYPTGIYSLMRPRERPLSSLRKNSKTAGSVTPMHFPFARKKLASRSSTLRLARQYPWFRPYLPTPWRLSLARGSASPGIQRRRVRVLTDGWELSSIIAVQTGTPFWVMPAPLVARLRVCHSVPSTARWFDQQSKRFLI